jgi:hypothetical protein
MSSGAIIDIPTSDSDSETTKSTIWQNNDDPSLYYRDGLSLSLSSSETSSASTVVNIEIKETIRVKKGKCSQLVVVEVGRSYVKGLPRKSLVIAKIFDPLYLSPNELVDSGFQNRATLLAYCAKTEFRAYSRLKSLQGKCIPRCYGLFTLRVVDRPDSLDRHLNVLLLQHVGTPPPDTQFLDQPTKRRMVQSMRSAFKQIHDRNMLHGDPALRNVVFNASKKAFVIDFEKARFLEDLQTADHRTYIRWENRSFDNQLEYYDFIPAKTPWLAELYARSRERDRGTPFHLRN